MNEKIMRDLGFGLEMDLVKERKCSSCGETINPDNFRDELSKKEYKISGMCQKCQETIWPPK